MGFCFANINIDAFTFTKGCKVDNPVFVSVPVIGILLLKFDKVLKNSFN